MSILQWFQSKSNMEITIHQLGENQWVYCTDGYSSYEVYPTAVDAANGAAKLALGNKGAVVKLDDCVRDSLIARWEMEGINAFRDNTPALCWTSHHRKAYQAAKADAQQVRVFGWPVLEKVAV